MKHLDAMSGLSTCAESCEMMSVLYENQTVQILAVLDDDSTLDKMMLPYEVIDRMSKRYETRLDLLVVRRGELDDLLAQGPGNDAKHILDSGTMVCGDMPAIYDDVQPPDPTCIAEDVFEYNMYRYGFKLMRTTRHTIRKTHLVRPEYLIAGVLFGMHTRRISSGIPVVMCNARMSYGLLLYLARSYGFAGRLLGIMLDIRAEGRLVGTVDESTSILEKCGTNPKVPFRDSVREALDTYGC